MPKAIGKKDLMMLKLHQDGNVTVFRESKVAVFVSIFSRNAVLFIFALLGNVNHF
jgi:hypothetical protein